MIRHHIRVGVAAVTRHRLLKMIVRAAESGRKQIL